MVIVGVFFPLALAIVLVGIFHIILDCIEHYQYYKNFFWMKEWSVLFMIRKHI